MATTEILDQNKSSKSTFSKEDLSEYKDIILQKRSDAVTDIDRMRAEVAKWEDRGSEDSAYSFHMADAGTDAMEREKRFMMIARQQKYVGYLDRALERIENGTYGICKVTGVAIGKERLRAVPHTEISIEAKKEQSNGK